MSAIPVPPASPPDPGSDAEGLFSALSPFPHDHAAQMALLAAVVESSDDAIISTTLEGQILSWNAGATRLFGYTAAEAIGQPISLIIPAELVQREAEILTRLRSGAHIEHFETERVRKDGERLQISLTVSPIRDSRGVIIGASKIARDIGELRRGEQLRAQLAAIVESSDDAIVGKNLDGIVQSWNASAVRIFGYEPHEAIGRHITFIIPPELRSEEDEIIAQLRAGRRIDHFDTVRVSKSGRRVNVSLSISPIRDGRGRVVGAAKIARDVTQRKRMEAALRDSEQALRLVDQRKDAFLAQLAHELRNFLAPISYALQIARNRELPPAQQERAHEIIGRQVRHMGCLLDDLKELTRIKRNALQLNLASAELTTILGSAIEAARPKLDEKHHVLSLDLPERAVRVHVDAVRLVQVFANLLINAAKYTDPGGHIRLSARCEQGELRVAVRDNGIGIAPDMLPRVFALFGQAPEALTRSEGGLGIGLALVKGVVELHGGRVEASSEGPGKGSEFRVCLPLDAEAGAPGAGGSSHESVIGLRVLVVDADEAAAGEAAMFVTLAGHHARTVAGTAEASQQIESFRPHVCMVDLAAGTAAYQLARDIHAASWGRHCVLIGMGAAADPVERERAQAAGFAACIDKPVTAASLEALLTGHGGQLRERIAQL